MYEWLLILSAYNSGISTTKLPDKESCYRAARVARQIPGRQGYAIDTGCVEITKETILIKEQH